MTEVIQLGDLIAFYPERNDINLQAIITSKQEFKELASSPNESIPQIQGELFNHQKFFGRLMQHYDAGLVIDKPGTGKTCKIVTAMEFFQRNRGIVREFYVVVPNKAVKHDVKRQIICMCDTGERYKLDIKNKGPATQRTLAGQRAAASKKLSRFYKIFTHGEFARFIIDNYPDAGQIVENEILTKRTVFVEETGKNVTEYSGIAERIINDFPEWKVSGPRGYPLKGKDLENFIVEKYYEHPDLYKIRLSEREIERLALEFHNKMVTEMSGAFYYIDEGHLLISSDMEESKKPSERRKHKYFKNIERVLQSVKRSKKVITTATPMINTPDDIRPLINLLRNPNDLLPEDFDYTGSSIEEVNYYFGGYITYVAPIDNKVDLLYMGENAGYKRVKDNTIVSVGEVRVVKLQMSDFQNYYYNQYYKSDSAGSFKSNSLQAGVFIYPDGSVGNKGLKKYINRPDISREEGETVKEFRERKRRSNKWFRVNNIDNFPQLISSIDGIYQLSAKFAEIAKAALSDKEGVIYVNIYYVDGGAIPLALCLEHLGFEIFTSQSSVFETSSKTVRPYCPEGSLDVSIRRGFEPKPRCAIYSSDKVFPDTVNESALELVNSKQNVFGEYIKVFIVTPVGKVGISINNVSKVFTVTPDWNESNTIQKEYRAIRATSHTTKIKELQKQALDVAKRNRVNLTYAELDSVRAELQIFRLAAISSEEDSADIDIYATAKEKELIIQNFFRKLMIVAIDCQLNKARNQMLKFEDGSAECNYQSCQYTCYGEGNYTTDYSTYDIYYLGEILESIIDEIVPLARRYGSMTYDQLISSIPRPEKHITVALAELINNKRSIKDRFGYTVYIQEHNGIIYFSREYPISESEYALSFYGRNLINVYYSSFNEIIDVLSDNLGDTIIDLIEMDYETVEFYNELESLSLTLKASILENAILDLEKSEPDKFSVVITNYFENRWFKMREPLDLIEEEISKVANKSNRGRPATRKPKKYKVNRLSDEQELIEDEQGEEVYFHILYTEQEAQTKHGEIARVLKAEGRYRLFKPSEGKWRDMSKFELSAYNLYIQNERVRKEKQMKSKFDFPIYGRLNKEGDLWIVDKTKEPPNPNGQTLYRGKRCVTWSKHELVPILFELGVPPVEEYLDIPVDLNIAIEKIINDVPKMKLKNFNVDDVPDWQDEQIKSYYRWLLIADRKDHTYSKTVICKLITSAMIEQDRIITF